MTLPVPGGDNVLLLEDRCAETMPCHCEACRCGRWGHALALLLCVACGSNGEPSSYVYSFAQQAYDVTPNPQKNNSIFVLTSSGQYIYEYDNPSPGLMAKTTIASFYISGNPKNDGPIGVASISSSYAFAVNEDGTTFYIADTFGYRIRKVTISSPGTGEVVNIVGNATLGSQNSDGFGPSLAIGKPQGIAFSSIGASYYIYYTDSTFGRIKRYDPITKHVTNVVGSSASGWKDGHSSAVGIGLIYGLHVTEDGTRIFFADRGANKIRMHNTTSNMVTTVAGSGARSTMDGPATSATFYFPIYISLNEQRNMLYISQMGSSSSSDSKVRRLNLNSFVVESLAGDGTRASLDGPGSSAQIGQSFGITHLPSNASHIFLAQPSMGRLRGIVEFPDTPIVIASNAPSTTPSTVPSTSPVSGSSASPTTESPTTESPTTASPTTESPTTTFPTTASPTTESPTTESPTTAFPTTAPTTAPTKMPSGFAGPVPTSGQFSASYQTAKIKFNMATSQPAVSCAVLFTDSSVASLGSNHRCYWEDAYTLVVVLGAGFTLVPSGSLTLKASTIASANNTQDVNSYSQVVVTHASETTVPGVNLVGETTIGLCDGVSEITANGEGSLAKPFIYSWAIVNNTGLKWERSLSTVAAQTTTSVFVLNGTQIPLGQNVTVAVTVKNWLNDSATAHLRVSKVHNILPILRLSCSPNITARRSEVTDIHVQVRIPKCSGNLRVDTFWRQLKGPHQISLSSTRSPSIRIPALSLQPMSFYQLQFVAKVVSILSNTTVGQKAVIFNVNVVDEPLRARIKGGSTRTVPIVPAAAAYSLQIDASSSMDPGYPSSPESLSFSWSIYDSSTNTESQLVSTSAVISLSTSQLVANRRYEVRVRVSSNRTLATNTTASQTLLTTSHPAPKVSISSPVINGVHDTREKLILSAKVTRVDSSGSEDDDASLALSWSCDAIDFNISDRRNLRSAVDARDLIIAPNVLIPGKYYRFNARSSVQIGAVLATGSASLVIRTNSPPSAGGCSSYPKFGVALETDFLLVCESFVDYEGDLPLKYKFQVVQVHNTQTVLDSQECSSPSAKFLDICRFRSLQSYKTKLTGVSSSSSPSSSSSSSSSDNRLLVRAIISDNLGAQSYFYFSVNVTQPSVINFTEINSALGERLQEGDTESFVMEAAAVASYLSSNIGVSQTSEYDAGEEREELLGKVKTAVKTYKDTASSLKLVVVARLAETLTTVGRPNEITNNITDSTLDLVEGIIDSYDGNSFLAEEEISTVTAASGAISNLLTAAHYVSVKATTNRRTEIIDSMNVQYILSNLSTMLAVDLVPGEDGLVAGTQSSIMGEISISISSLRANVGKNVNMSLSSLERAIVGLDMVYIANSSGTTSIQMGYVAITGGRGGSIFPFPKNITTNHTSGLAIVEIKAVLPTGEAVIVKTASKRNSPYRIQITSDNNGDSLPMQGDTTAVRECVFWDESSSQWSTDGVKYIGLTSSGNHMCESTHLTVFSTRPTFQVEVNTFSESDIKDTKAYNLLKSPTMALTVIMTGILILLFVFAVFLDNRTATTTHGVITVHEREFYRSINQSRKLHLEEPRSDANWRKSINLAVRRRHPWMSIFIRLPGDYMDSKKRLLILSLLVFNAAAICALLVGTEQRLGFIEGNIAVAIVAMAIGFPLPYLVTTIFSRETPNEFRMSFTPLGIVGAMPWLLWGVTVLMGELELDFGLNAEDENDAEADDGGADEDANENRVGEGDDDDDENHKKKDKKNDFQETAAIASGAGIGGAVGFDAASSPKESKYQKLERNKSVQSFKTNWRLNVSTQSISDKNADGTFHSTKLNKNDNRTKSSEGGRRKETNVRICSTEGERSTVGCCGQSKGMHRPSHNQWETWDFLGGIICIIASLGCAFVAIILAHQTAQKEDADWNIMVAAILALPQDFGARLCTILWLEAIITGPMLYACFPCFMVCSLCPATDDVRVSDSSLTFQFDVDEGVCRLDKQNIVTHVYPQAKAVVSVGWRLVKLNDIMVATKEDTIRELKRVHMLQRHFLATFDDFRNSHVLGDENQSKHNSNDVKMERVSEGNSGEWSPPHIDFLRRQVWERHRRQETVTMCKGHIVEKSDVGFVRR